MTPTEGIILKETGGIAIKEAGKLSTELIEWISSGGRKRIIKWNRYALVYAPLRMALFDLHIALYRSDEKLSIEKRWEKAKPELLKLRFKSFIEKISEAKVYNEIEISGINSFPITKIKEILDKSPEWADSKLINLFHWVVKADVEDSLTSNYSRDFLTEEESELRYYILEVYEKLNKEFIG